MGALSAGRGCICLFCVNTDGIDAFICHVYLNTTENIINNNTIVYFATENSIRLSSHGVISLSNLFNCRLIM